MTILSRHTHTRREGRLATIAVWAWIIVSALIRRGNRAAGQREDPPVAEKPLAASPRPKPAARPQEASRRGLETVALLTQIIALPLAVAGLIYAGLSYSHQAADTQQALAAIRVQQQEIAAQQRTINAQMQQLAATKQSATIQKDLAVAIHQLITVEQQLAAQLAVGGN
jgi:hypothetical protein